MTLEAVRRIRETMPLRRAAGPSAVKSSLKSNSLHEGEEERVEGGACGGGACAVIAAGVLVVFCCAGDDTRAHKSCPSCLTTRDRQLANTHATRVSYDPPTSRP